jgi:hypothetical protein
VHGTSGKIEFDYIIDAAGQQGLISTKYHKDRKMTQSLKVRFLGLLFFVYNNRRYRTPLSGLTGRAPSGTAREPSDMVIGPFSLSPPLTNLSLLNLGSPMIEALHGTVNLISD